MGILKNVASQKVGFVMVDKTDFATPETGISPSGVIRKDGGASAAITNTVSELTNGYYVLTLTNSETNANLIQLRFHDSGTSCATQFVVLYTDAGKLSDIHSAVDETLSHLDNGTYGLDALETLLSDTQSHLDSAIHSTIDAIHSTLDGPIDSAITQNTALISDVLSTIDDVVGSQIASILTDTNATLDNKLDSILEDTKTTLDNKIDSILVDTGTTVDNKIDSILVYVNSAIAEMAAGAPPASPTPRQVQNYMYRMIRNQIKTDSGVQKVYADDTTTVLFSCAVSDDATTFTKGEHA
jgi:hypothetical protein